MFAYHFANLHNSIQYKWGVSSLNNVITPKTRQKFRALGRRTLARQERQKEKVADYSTTMLYNVLTVRNLLPVCFKRLQGQLLRLTTLRCRDEAIVRHASNALFIGVSDSKTGVF